MCDVYTHASSMRGSRLHYEGFMSKNTTPDFSRADMKHSVGGEATPLQPGLPEMAGGGGGGGGGGQGTWPLAESSASTCSTGRWGGTRGSPGPASMTSATRSVRRFPMRPAGWFSAYCSRVTCFAWGPWQRARRFSSAGRPRPELGPITLDASIKKAERTWGCPRDDMAPSMARSSLMQWHQRGSPGILQAKGLSGFMSAACRAGRRGRVAQGWFSGTTSICGNRQRWYKTRVSPAAVSADRWLAMHMAVYKNDARRLQAECSAAARPSVLDSDLPRVPTIAPA